MLKTPWKVDMIGRPYPSSTATAWTFIDTSSRPNPMPKTNRDSIKSGIEGARGSSGNDAQRRVAATRMTRGLPHSRTSHPVMGIAMMAPTEVLNRATPSWASSSRRAVLNGRNARHPAPEHGAKEEEKCRCRPAGLTQVIGVMRAVADGDCFDSRNAHPPPLNPDASPHIERQTVA